MINYPTNLDIQYQEPMGTVIKPKTSCYCKETADDDKCLHCKINGCSHGGKTTVVGEDNYFTYEMCEECSDVYPVDKYPYSKEMAPQEFEGECNHHFEYCIETGTDACVYCAEDTGESKMYDEIISGASVKRSRFNHLTHRKWDEEYDPVKYVKKSFLRKYGYEHEDYRHSVTYDVQLYVFKRLQNPFSWKNVYEIMKEVGLEDFWEGFGVLFMEQPINDDHWCYKTEWMMFEILKKCTEIAKKYNWNTKKINHWYLLKRLEEVVCRKEASVWLPIKPSGKKIKEYEDKFKDICKEFDIQYEEPVLHKRVKVGGTFNKTIPHLVKYTIEPPLIHWDKLGTLRQLRKKCLIRRPEHNRI